MGNSMQLAGNHQPPLAPRPAELPPPKPLPPPLLLPPLNPLPDERVDLTFLGV
jgi:hypothetical protein